MHLIQIASALIVMLLCLTTISAQSGRKVTGKPVAPKDEPAIRIRTDEVQLAVTVRDSLGRTVTGLQAADFSIYDNGKRYEPVRFDYRYVPVNLLLLLDGSGGFFPDKEAIRQVLLTFRRNLAPTDRLAVMQFTDELILTQDWDNDESALHKALKPALRPGGKAALTDALALAAAKFDGTTGRRVIMLLTGGLNNAGLSDFKQALMAMQNVAATVYVFSETEALAAALRQQRAKAVADMAKINFSLTWLAEVENKLTVLAEANGGKIFFPLQERSLFWMLADMVDELRGQYLMSYVPDDESGDPRGAHLIQVLVRDGHQTYARTGTDWPSRQRLLRGAQLIPVSASRQR